MEWRNRKTHWHEAVSSALNFSFLKEVSQNCFFLVLNCCIFDVVNFKKLRKSRRIAIFMLQSSKAEEVSQNSSVFKFPDRHIERERERQRDE